MSKYCLPGQWSVNNNVYLSYSYLILLKETGSLICSLDQQKTHLISLLIIPGSEILERKNVFIKMVDYGIYSSKNETVGNIYIYIEGV